MLHTFKNHGFKKSSADSFTLSHNFVDYEARRCESNFDELFRNFQENSSWEDDMIMIRKTQGSI